MSQVTAAAVLAVGLALYLMYVLIFPERFN
jgi:K+-transporting ATPase KdpF subunit